jgi:hypothetical protein
VNLETLLYWFWNTARQNQHNAEFRGCRTGLESVNNWKAKTFLTFLKHVIILHFQSGRSVQACTSNVQAINIWVASFISVSNLRDVWGGKLHFCVRLTWRVGNPQCRGTLIISRYVRHYTIRPQSTIRGSEKIPSRINLLCLSMAFVNWRQKFHWRKNGARGEGTWTTDMMQGLTF